MKNILLLSSIIIAILSYGKEELRPTIELIYEKQIKGGNWENAQSMLETDEKDLLVLCKT